MAAVFVGYHKATAFFLMEVRISHSIGAMVAMVCHGATSIGIRAPGALAPL